MTKPNQAGPRRHGHDLLRRSAGCATSTIEYQQTQSNYYYGYGPTTYKVCLLQYRLVHPPFLPRQALPPNSIRTKAPLSRRMAIPLRVGTDIQLGDNSCRSYVATARPQTTNADLYEGYDNYSIYIDKAFAGWTPTDWFTLVLGSKQSLYTTILSGTRYHPGWRHGGLRSCKGLPRNGLPALTQFVALQGAYNYNAASNFGDINHTNAWQFAEQLKGPGTSIMTSASPLLPASRLIMMRHLELGNNRASTIHRFSHRRLLP